MLLRNLLKLQVAGARAESADGNDDHGHGEGDQAEYAGGAVEVGEEEPDDEARENGADVAERIGKANRARPHVIDRAGCQAGQDDAARGGERTRRFPTRTLQCQTLTREC